MTRAIFLAAALAVAGCSDRQVVVELQPEDGCNSACGQGDLSCLEHLKVVVFAKDEIVASACEDVAATQRTVCEPVLRDALQIKIPQEADWLSVAGLGPGKGDGCAGPPLFVAGAAFSVDQSTVHLTTRCTLGCAREERSQQLLITDLMASGPPPSVTELKAEIGVLYDAGSLLGSSSDPAFEPFAVSMDAAPTADGLVSLTGEFFGPVAEKLCFAARVEGGEGRFVSCLVGGDERAEVAVLSGVDHDLLVDLLAQSGRDPGAGFLLLRVMKDSEQTLDQVTASTKTGANVLYGLDYDPNDSSWSLEEEVVSATTSSGLLVVLGSFVGEVTLEAPGYEERTVLVGTIPSHAAAMQIILSAAD